MWHAFEAAWGVQENTPLKMPREGVARRAGDAEDAGTLSNADVHQFLHRFAPAGD